MHDELVDESIIDEINAVAICNAVRAARVYVQMINNRAYGLEPTSLQRVFRVINAACPRCSGRWVTRIGEAGPHICNHCGSALGEFEEIDEEVQ